MPGLCTNVVLGETLLRTINAFTQYPDNFALWLPSAGESNFDLGPAFRSPPAEQFFFYQTLAQYLPNWLSAIPQQTHPQETYQQQAPQQQAYQQHAPTQTSSSVDTEYWRYENQAAYERYNLESQSILNDSDQLTARQRHKRKRINAQTFINDLEVHRNVMLAPASGLAEWFRNTIEELGREISENK